MVFCYVFGIDWNLVLFIKYVDVFGNMELVFDFRKFMFVLLVRNYFVVFGVWIFLMFFFVFFI